MHVCNQARRTRMQLCSQQKHDKRTTTVLILSAHMHLTFLYLLDMAPQHSFKEKPQERQGVELELAGLYNSRSSGDRKGSERLGWLPATFVVTRWGDPRRLVDTAVGAARLGWPRPRHAAWWFGPVRRRLRGTNGPVLFQS